MTRQIWLYWDCNKPSLIRIFDTLLKLNNPNTTIHFLDKDTVKDYVTIYPTYFKNLCPAHQADYIRVFLLYKYGGLWLDSDTLCIENLDEYLDNIDAHGLTLIAETESMLSNGIIGATKGHPFMQLWLREIVRIIDEKKGKINWCDIGSKIMMKLYIDRGDTCKNCLVYLAYNTIYNIPWQDCNGILLTRDADEFDKFYKKGQPMLITVNSLYNELKSKSARSILKNKNCVLFRYIQKSCSLKKIVMAMTKEDLEYCDTTAKHIDKIYNMPPFYYCNLARHKARNDYIIDLFRKYKITNYKRIDGYDASLDNSFYIPTKVSRFPEGHIPAEYGCLASHIKAVKDFYENSEYNAAIICEDDFAMDYTQYWDKPFNCMLDKLPWDFDCCLLSFMKASPEGLSINLQNFIYGGEYVGSAAYLISKKGAKKIVDSLKYKDNKLDFSECEEIPADYYLYNQMDKIYVIPLFTYVGDNSTIHSEHVAYHKDRKEKLKILWEKNKQP